MSKFRLLVLADTWCHKACDWYIDATMRGHHLPGWGLLQLWQWRLCNAYERSAWLDTRSNASSEAGDA